MFRPFAERFTSSRISAMRKILFNRWSNRLRCFQWRSPLLEHYKKLDIEANGTTIKKNSTISFRHHQLHFWHYTFFVVQKKCHHKNCHLRHHNKYVMWCYFRSKQKTEPRNSSYPQKHWNVELIHGFWISRQLWKWKILWVRKWYFVGN